MTDQPRDPRQPDPASGSSTRPDGAIPSAPNGGLPPQAPAYGEAPYGQQAGAPGQYGGQYGQVPPPPPPAGGYDPAYGQPAPQGGNGLAIGALVCGILAVIGSCCGGWGGVVLGIAAIVLAVMARKKAAQGLARRSGMATAGMVLGIIGLLLGLMVAFAGMILGPKADACKSLQNNQQEYGKCLMEQITGQKVTDSPTAP